jgi:hypothetical protein
MTWRGEVITGGLVLVFVLWSGHYHTWATLILLAGISVWFVDASLFAIDDCWCDRGWIVSRLSGKRRPHKACGNTGRRPRLAHRVFHKRAKG